MSRQFKTSFDPAMTCNFPEPDFAVQLKEELPLADVRHVLFLFAGDLERLTVGIRTAAESSDAMAMRRTAHALAGAAGAVGASDLEHSCRAAMSGLKPDESTLFSLCLAIEGAAAAAQVALERVRMEIADNA
jgi:chemotaxis protein histidine kinase CheA